MTYHGYVLPITKVVWEWVKLENIYLYGKSIQCTQSSLAAISRT